MNMNTPFDPKSALDAYVDSFNADEYSRLRVVLSPDFRRVAPDFKRRVRRR